MKLIQDLLEVWGDRAWENDLRSFVSHVQAQEADTDQSDIDLLKDMLLDIKSMKEVKGRAMFKLLNIIISIKTKNGSEMWEEKERLVNHFVAAALNGGDEGVKDLMAEVDQADLKHVCDKNLLAALKLRISKNKRTPEEIKFDEDYDMFIFIAKDKFVEHPAGSGNYRKTLDIENLYKVDRFEMADHSALKMMKIRVQHQGDGSQVYAVELPKDAMPGEQKANHNIPDWLVSLIDEHKRRI